MPKGTSIDSKIARLLPVAVPGPVVPAVDDWHGRGLCVGKDPDAFFPSRGDPGTKAREICTACAVRAQCLDYAARADEFGIWGGLDQQERRNWKRKRQRRQKAAQAPEASATRRTGAA